MAIMEMAGVGPKTFQHLLLAIGPPENLIKASRADFEEIPRIGEKGADRMFEALESIAEFESRLNGFEGHGINVASYFDDDYPEMLRKIDDPPPILYMKGNKKALEFEYVAMVGTTRASETGIRLAVDLAKEFVQRGLGIVSGLAIGIDSAAHLGALKENGKTIAILGCGHFNIYPKENLPLAENIARDGLVISEQDPFKKVRSPSLILRNRLISALSKGVVVVQVGVERKGELRTVNYANKQAKPVFFADPEKILNDETISSAQGVLIKGTESVDEIIRYMV